MKKEYPIPQVERENLEYAKILLQDYAGQVSEDSAVHLYLYEHFTKEKEWEEFGKILKEISITEMIHMALLGETIQLLGLDPKFETIDTKTSKRIPWNASYVPYPSTILEMLNTNIQAEKKAILQYRAHQSMIQDFYIKILLEKIIEDEEEHIRIFQKLINQYQKKSQS